MRIERDLMINGGDLVMKSNGFRFVDDRGVLDQVFNDDLPFKVKRCYTLHHQGKVIRGWHGHKEEWKALYCTRGSFKVLVAKMKNLIGKELPNDSEEFSVNERKNEILVIKPGYYHALVNLEDDSKLMVFSSSTLEESKNDDYRYGLDKDDHRFEVKPR